MDSLTQAVLGATLQGAMLGRWQGRKALVYGALLGTLPDMDVLIDYGDAVADMTYHRGFSHSLLVLGAVALLLTWLIRRFRPHPGYSGRRLLATLSLVLLTHPLLDCFTSYGTQILWPLASVPTSWSSVFIIDPLYTLPLLAAVLAGLIFGPGRHPARPALAALALSSLYLGSTVAGKQMAEERVQAELARQGIVAERLFSSPTPFNSLLWRVVALGPDEHYHEALVGWFDQRPPQLYRINRGSHLAEVLKDSPSHARLAWFTDGILRYDQVGERLVVTDLRLGMTGFHPFRFDFAQWHEGAWQLREQVPLWPMARADLGRLGMLWQRIWQPELEIPLSAWASQLGEPLLGQAP